MNYLISDKSLIITLISYMPSSFWNKMEWDSFERNSFVPILFVLHFLKFYKIK